MAIASDQAAPPPVQRQPSARAVDSNERPVVLETPDRRGGESRSQARAPLVRSQWVTNHGAPSQVPGSDRRPGPPAPAMDDEAERGTTGPQLRRFIKSRAYVPMHELRRRFAINGHDDDVTAVDVDKRRVFVGLPDREGRLLGELLRGGDIGYELSLDPISPIVVGVYPMRPVTRP